MPPQPSPIHYLELLGEGPGRTRYWLAADRTLGVLRVVAEPRPTPSAAPPRLANFTFLELLGSGGFGEVWLARDDRLNALRAVKIVLRRSFSEQAVANLVQEAQVMARLPTHPHRVQVHSLVPTVTNCFLIMTYVAGGSLLWQTRAGKPTPWARALRLVAEAADGLGAVHERGLLHRDIKPDNLLVDLQGGVDVDVYHRPDERGDAAVLGDFGIAAALRTAGRGGTLGYIAPELGGPGQATPRADVYSLAATLLHLGTGVRPAGAPLAGLTLPANLPAEVREVLAAGLTPDPAARDDLPVFLVRLREAYGRLVTARLDDLEATPHPVRLNDSVYAAPPGAAFKPLLADRGGYPVSVGDQVQVNADASADGHFAFLYLHSDGRLTVELPSPHHPNSFCRAGHRAAMELTIEPPGGLDRMVVVWTRKPIAWAPRRWRRCLEANGLEGLGTDLPEEEPLRGGRVVAVAVNTPPAGDRKARVLSFRCRPR